MNECGITAQVTFTYYEDINEAAKFYEDVLGLKRVYDTGWCYIWQSAEKAFVSACDEKHTELDIRAKDGVLLSFSVKDVELVKNKILQSGIVEKLPELIIGQEVPLKTLIFRGPGGYMYEVMEFTDPKLLELF